MNAKEEKKKTKLAKIVEHKIDTHNAMYCRLLGIKMCIIHVSCHKHSLDSRRGNEERKKKKWSSRG